MAVLSRDSNTNKGGNTNTSDKNDRPELLPISLEDLKKRSASLVSVQMDLEEDAWEFSAPPPKGRYQLRIFLGQDGYQQGYLNYKNPKDTEIYVSAPLQCKIVSDNPDYDGVVVFPRVSTKIGRGKNNSTMMGLVVKGLGPKAVNKSVLNVYEQVAIFNSFLKKEPIVEADLDWRGSYQQPDGEYKNVYRHFEEFPKDDSDPTGTTRHHLVDITADDGSKVEVRAQLYVANWYAKGEASKVENKGQGGVQVPLQFVSPGGNGTVQQTLQPVQNMQPVVQPVQQMPVNIPAPISNQQVANGPVQQTLPGTTNQQSMDDDISLLLSE